MLRTRAALVLATAAATAFGGSIAAAQADSGASGATGATGSTGAASAATITMNGSGTVTLAAGASSSAISAAYLSALTAALGDAHTKAADLSGAVGDTLGAVENITEESTDDGLCSSPMFVNASAKGAPSVAPKPSGKKHGHKKTHAPLARAADVAATSCTVQADVTVTYAMGPA